MTAVQLVIDGHDPRVLVSFWCLALDSEPAPPPEGCATWNDWYASVGVPDEELDPTYDGTDRIRDPAGQGMPIWFQIVPEDKQVKNRLHLDLLVGRDADGTKLPFPERARKVQGKADLLLAAGATQVAFENDPERDRYSVGLLDPEGNELCIV